jgi:hypothetical protein
MRIFWVSLAAGVAVVAAFALIGAVPLAVVAAAVVVPTLVVLYLVDVDVYEDHAALVLLLTLVWGLGMGLVVHQVGRLVTPTGADLLAQSTSETVLYQGVLIPLLGLVLALSGPLLVLRRYRQFNDPLDGTTFGAVAGGTLFATQLLAQAASLLDDGVRPDVTTPSWAFRAVQLAVVFPLLWASISGAAAGTVWPRLQHAALVDEIRRWSLALGISSAVVIAASTAQFLLPLLAAIGVSVVLASLSLLWLRRQIHVGLLAEAGERSIGGEIVCADCHRPTPAHTFCGHCGMALAALPKGRDSSTSAYRSGDQETRFPDRVIPAVTGALLLVTAGVATGWATVRAPDVQAACTAERPCGTPDDMHEEAPLRAPWESSTGILVEFDHAQWRADGANSDHLRLINQRGDTLLEIRVDTNPSARLSTAPALPVELDSLRRLEIPGPYGPNIGHVGGIGDWWKGFLSSGRLEPVTIASLTSMFGRDRVVATAVFYDPPTEVFSKNDRRRRQVDSILNAVTMRSSERGSLAAKGKIRLAGTPTHGSHSARTGMLPADVRLAYGVDPLWERGIQGEGVTIALVSFSSFDEATVREYDRLVGADGMRPIRKTGTSSVGGSYETHLNINVIRAIAPHASIIVYEAPANMSAMVDVLRRINQDNEASIVSISWGRCAEFIERTNPKLRIALGRELFATAEHQRTVFAASGDSGAFSCLHYEDELDRDQHVESLDWPSASPYVVSVGGTRLLVWNDGSYYDEDAWENTLATEATGGGISPYDLRPPWQRGEGIDDAASAGGGRLVPDVAGPADCDSAFFVIWNDVEGRHEGPEGCGTSAAAPFWAAITALVQQYAGCHGIERLGFLGETLYDVERDHPRAFHDIRTGGNLKYKAGPGWDHPTGLGSPNAWELAKAIVTHSGERPRTGPRPCKKN